MLSRRVPFALLAAVALCAPAWAQTPPPAAAPPEPLAAVRAKETLADDDRAAIRAFLAEKTAAVAGKDAAAAQEAMHQLRTASVGTKGYREAFVSLSADAVRGAYKSAAPLAAARLLTHVVSLESADTLPLLLEALQDERVAVRSTAAIGLRSIRERLAQAGAEFHGRALAALRDAAKKETSREALRLIYQAMNFAALPAPPDAKANTAALLDVLDERAKAYAAGDPKAVGGDDAGLALGGALLKSMSDDDKKRFGIATATLARFAVAQYTAEATKIWEARSGPTAELRDALERLILEGDRQLAALLVPSGKAPSVSDRMHRADRKGMRSEWKAWAELVQRAWAADVALPDDSGG